MAELKKHLPLSEQVDLLISRGLIINDKQDAEQLLFNTNYYRFTGYLHDFKITGTDNYTEGLDIERIRKLYYFDRRLARVIMYALGNVEETLKARLSYIVTDFNRDDPLVYTKPDIFVDKEKHDQFMRLFKQRVKDSSKLPFVIHHNAKYSGQLPMWVAVELLTMGNLSSLYGNLTAKYRKALARTYNTGPNQLENWIENLRLTRNHLAHYMRIYNFNFGRTPCACKNHPNTRYSSQMIFDQLCIASALYSDPVDWNDYILHSLWDTLDEYKESIDLGAVGFPENWIDLLTMRQAELVTV